MFRFSIRDVLWLTVVGLGAVVPRADNGAKSGGPDSNPKSRRVVCIHPFK